MDFCPEWRIPLHWFPHETIFNCTLYRWCFKLWPSLPNHAIMLQAFLSNLAFFYMYTIRFVGRWKPACWIITLASCVQRSDVQGNEKRPVCLISLHRNQTSLQSFSKYCTLSWCGNACKTLKPLSSRLLLPLTSSWIEKKKLKHLILICASALRKGAALWTAPVYWVNK